MTGKNGRATDYSRYLPLLLTLTTNQNQTMTIAIKMFHNIQKTINFQIHIMCFTPKTHNTYEKLVPSTTWEVIKFFMKAVGYTYRLRTDYSANLYTPNVVSRVSLLVRST